MKLIDCKSRDAISNTVMDLVWIQVDNQVWIQFKKQVSDKCEDPEYRQFSGQVKYPVRNQVWDQVGNKVMNELGKMYEVN